MKNIEHFPYIITPKTFNLDLIKWSKDNKANIKNILQKNGAILFRGFNVSSPEILQQFMQSISNNMMTYQDRATPRSQVSDKIFTATNFPPEHTIFLHNEQSFAYTWPGKLAFACLKEPETGGETPIADVRKVYNRIKPNIRKKFIEKKIKYVRNFGSPFGLSWKEVFQISDKSEMEDYCDKSGIKFQWKENGKLRTEQIADAAIRHPITNELVWFNHAATLHISTLDQNKQHALKKLFKNSDLPTNTYYGDGEPIEAEVLDTLREAYNNETVTFPWKVGDVLLLDNMLVAHGRKPFTGKREIVVGMADPVSRNTVGIKLYNLIGEYICP